MRRLLCLQKIVMLFSVFWLLVVVVVALSAESGGVVGVTPSAQPGRLVTRSIDGRYVFPLAVPPRWLAWTHYHWDGGNAVDVEAAPELRPRSEEYERVVRADVLAVTSGVARPLDNLRGGISVVLMGDDGRQYYYAHLRRRTVQSPTRVQAGDVLGQVGNTGQWSQFLEPHLHFSIANGHHDGYIWESDVHGAGFLAEHFGLDWRHRENSVYQPDEPHGWPFPEPGRIVQDFAQTSRVAREQGALLLAPPEPVLLRLAGDAQGESPEEQQRSLARVPVVSPMEGMISYSRDTIFGERIQIVNEHTGHLLVLFGVNVALRRSGLMVRRGQLLGWVSPGQPLRLQYFRGGRPRDYEPLLDSSRDLLE